MAYQLHPPSTDVDYLFPDEMFWDEFRAAIRRRQGYKDNHVCPHCGSSDYVRDYPEVSPDAPLVRVECCPKCGELARYFIPVEEWSRRIGS
jgi:predicted RNA-binding Zn-ribbon protein involved in translation (DUF1610 family)